MKLSEGLYEFKPWILIFVGVVGYNQLYRYPVGRYSSILLLMTGAMILWVRWYYRRRKARKRTGF